VGLFQFFLNLWIEHGEIVRYNRAL
jgi:hypothetical protein